MTMVDNASGTDHPKREQLAVRQDRTGDRSFVVTALYLLLLGLAGVAVSFYLQDGANVNPAYNMDQPLP